MHGDVSFIEIGTTDTGRTQTFFESVFGWNFHPMTQGGGWFQAPSIRVGLHGNDPEPQMYLFLGVADLERAIEVVREAGGEAETVQDEPGFGRFCSCRDPRGIRFGLHQRPTA